MSARTSRLQLEIATYEAKRAELVEAHRDEYVLIKGNAVIGCFGTEEEGLAAGYDQFLDEPFLLRRVEESTTPIFFTSLYLGL